MSEGANVWWFYFQPMLIGSTNAEIGPGTSLATGGLSCPANPPLGLSPELYAEISTAVAFTCPAKQASNARYVLLHPKSLLLSSETNQHKHQLHKLRSHLALPLLRLRQSHLPQHRGPDNPWRRARLRAPHPLRLGSIHRHPRPPHTSHRNLSAGHVDSIRRSPQNGVISCAVPVAEVQFAGEDVDSVGV